VLLEGWSPAGRSRRIQVAVSGRWEESRQLAIPADEGSVRSLVRDAAPADADVAAEFEWLGHPLVFVGARRGRDEQASFEAAVARVVALDPDDPALALATLAGGEPGELDHVELGAANAWQSVGPLRLWIRGEPPPPATRLGDHPALALSPVPVALEAAFRTPRECWLGVELSEPSGAEYVLAAEAVDAVLARLFVPGTSSRR
jgi:hypothetical protein